MATLNAKQLTALQKKGEPCRESLGNGLYFRVSNSATASFEVRYSIYGKRRFISLKKPYPALSLAEARLKAAEIKMMVKEGEDPLEHRKLDSVKPFKLLDALAEDWLQEQEKRIKTGHIYRRVYQKDISPMIGGIATEKIRPLDIRTVIKSIDQSGRPSIANDALNYLKHIFRHGIKLGIIETNPADAFQYVDAGGIEKARQRALSINEIKELFEVLTANSDQVTRENYLAVALLISLATRKMELMAATWSEFDLDKGTWTIPAERTKTGVSIRMPLSAHVSNWLEELKIRSAASEYVFPNRRKSKRPYVSPDTLNAAIGKLFKEEKISFPHFTIHDLRRSARTLLASLQVPPHISERCLNHKIQGVEGVYDQYDYFNERKEALEKISNLIAPYVNQG
ncbi:tyrosine-type recombinase/integrase [Colwelliaceae bacterium BS250]